MSIAKFFSFNFHHVGLLTAVPEKAIINLALFGYSPTKSLFDPEQDVSLTMCESDQDAPRIELVTPANTNISLSRLLRRKDDYGYHTCFAVSSIGAAIQQIEAAGAGYVREVVPPKPAALFGGALVAFYLLPGIGLIELLESK